MTPELIRIYAAVIAEQARLLAMQAENQQRAALGHSMAYVEEDFGYVAAELDRLSTQARNAT